MRLSARSLILVALVVIAGCIIATRPSMTPVVYAQTVPTVVHAQWNPNPGTDNVTAYQVTLDGGAPITVAPTVDATCSCVQTALTIPAFGAHTVNVVAQNLLISTDGSSSQQSSAATTLPFSLNRSPATVTGGAVKK